LGLRIRPADAVVNVLVGVRLCGVAWNTAETRRRLKQAAPAEFAAHGLHGTTMDRIAERASINKERLYHYFGNKEQLFATVLCDELAKIATAAPLESLRAEDVGEFAGQIFDYHAANPDLARLLHWEGLAFDGEVPDETGRAQYYRRKVEAFASAQRDGVLTDQLDAAHLAFFVIALSAWWFAVPQVARMLTGADGSSEAERTRRRAAVVQAARRLALPTTVGESATTTLPGEAPNKQPAHARTTDDPSADHAIR
jgi:AcrR family transcriptional regulator